MDDEIIAKLLLQSKKDEKGHLGGQSACILWDSIDRQSFVEHKPCYKE